MQARCRYGTFRSTWWPLIETGCTVTGTLNTLRFRRYRRG
ncbi:AAEL017550-PA [Aedes aegypti]|uniref:AAEL017550-PA n=1 Tax=Aedes aegypti TaxID=7159 RepID=J9E9C8_AEDAE|nr:AAEL017550-PA [Aedes aegypti]